MSEAEIHHVKVPFGLSAEGTEVHAREAERDEPYQCLSCHSALVLKRRPVLRAHFAHQVPPEECEFVHETEAHYRAKHRIKRLWDSGESILLLRGCAGCSSTIVQDVRNGRSARVAIEYVLPSGHRADAAILDEDGALRAVFEVYGTHKVDVEKAEALATQGIQWGEFAAETILQSAEWRPLRDEFGVSRCGACQEAAHREKMVSRFGKVSSFADEKRMKVSCPARGNRPVPIFGECVTCPHYVDSRPNGIFCIGSREGQ